MNRRPGVFRRVKRLWSGQFAGQEPTGAVGQFFSGYATDFDAIYGHTGRRNALGRWVDRTFRGVMARRFGETLRRTAAAGIATVLDVGCGSGRYLAALAKQGKSVVGVDVADGMLVLAQKVVGEEGVGDRVRLVKGDYLATALGGPFDAACLMGFFDYVGDPVPVLRKLERDVTELILASFPKAGGLLALQRRIRYRMRGCPLRLYRREEVAGLLDEAGFGGMWEIRDFGRDWYVVVELGRRREIAKSSG